MLKVLILSDSPLLNTGYANTLKQVADAFLEAGCHVEQIAFGMYEDNEYKYKLHKVPSNDFFGKSIFSEVVEKFLPNIVFTFHDLHNISWVGNFPHKFYKWVSYFPIDAEHLTVSQKYIIKQIDVPIVYSKTALNLVVSETKREDTKIIYHGIDTDKFTPLDKDEVKKKYRMDGKFIVGTVGRNNARKNFPALMEAFSKFAKGKDDTMLYIHSKPIDVGHNLYEYIMKYDLSNKVYFTQDMDGVIGLNDNELVELYSCFDILVSTTAGEGCGLVSLEAQSCEVPTLITNYSACKEFVPKDFRINVKAHYFEPFMDVERAIIDQDDLVEKMNRLYYNKDVLPVIGENARKYVEGFDWKNIKPLWVYFIKLYAEQEFGIKEDNNNSLSKFVRI